MENIKISREVNNHNELPGAKTTTGAKQKEAYEKYKSNRSVENRNDCISAHENIIFRLARQYSGSVDFEDLFQAGWIRAVQALEDYVPKSGSFATYLWRTLSGHFYNLEVGEQTRQRRYRAASGFDGDACDNTGRGGETLTQTMMGYEGLIAEVRNHLPEKDAERLVGAVVEEGSAIVARRNGCSQRTIQRRVRADAEQLALEMCHPRRKGKERHIRSSPRVSLGVVTSRNPGRV